MTETMRSKAYDEALEASQNKPKWSEVVKYTAFTALGGAAVGAAFLMGFESLMPHPDMMAMFAREGAIALPAVFTAIGAALGLATGVKNNMEDKLQANWANKELQEDAKLSPEELARKKERVGEQILLNRARAIEDDKKNESTMNTAVAVGTLVSLGM